jgi:O-methyltransferase
MKWQTAGKQLFRIFGYEIAQRGDIGTYMPHAPYGDCTYSPWFEDWFQEKYRAIKGLAEVAEDRCYLIHRFCQHGLHLAGDFAECGVYKGGTAMLIAQTLSEAAAAGKSLHLFDTFDGMPEFADDDASCYKNRDFGDTSLKTVQVRLRHFPFVEYHRGTVPETFRAVEDCGFAFVHIDVDLYQSTVDSFAFFYPRMVRGGILLCDDYGFPAFQRAAKRAVDEFFEDRPENPISLHSGQCLIIKA